LDPAKLFENYVAVELKSMIDLKKEAKDFYRMSASQFFA